MEESQPNGSWWLREFTYQGGRPGNRVRPRFRAMVYFAKSVRAIKKDGSLRRACYGGRPPPLMHGARGRELQKGHRNKERGSVGKKRGATRRWRVHSRRGRAVSQGGRKPNTHQTWGGI